jgi:Protein of unknown function (DUF3551)
MKLLLVLSGICVALLSIGTRADAQNYPWCAIYGGFGDGGTNCGFTTFQQCMDTAGNGQLVPTQHAICSSAWTAFIRASPKSLSSLSAIGRTHPS